jgi:hypothetical protein
MNLKSAIETLRTELRKFSTHKQSFADYKLTDGTLIRVDGDLVAGTAVYVITDDQALPAPDGEHQVEGVGVVKTVGGKIVEVVAATAPAEAVEVAAEITPEVATEVVGKIATGYPNVDPAVIEQIVKKHLVAIMDELKAAYTELGHMKEKMAAFASQMQTMTDIIEKVAEMPSESSKAKTSAIIEQRKAVATQNFNALAQTIQNLRKSK